ncbi:MAG TPA: Gmad2 immunoglobulin-like domain-containing protein [Salinimicrobium sp.]|nr:Gmad2 immunoglobulin-like domain-containing protein [Salinimicrobium sp.]
MMNKAINSGIKYSCLMLVILFSSCMDGKKESKPAVESKDYTSAPSEIKVEQPQPGEQISSPLEISGSARGMWFFEGSFAVYLFDEDQNEIAVAIATAQDNWMTEDFVPFTATMEFEVPDSKTGTIIFRKSNPSEIDSLDRSFEFPIKF